MKVKEQVLSTQNRTFQEKLESLAKVFISRDAIDWLHPYSRQQEFLQEE